MKKLIPAIIIITLIAVFALSCAVSSSGGGEAAAIEKVKDSLTSDVEGFFKAIEYEDGYVVNFDDMAYWYVEDGLVWSLNGFAKTYAENTQYKYGIDWEELF
jgi:hypothetical protein